MRQQFLNSAGLVRGQPGEYILMVGIRVVPVHTRRLDQAHDGGGPLTRAQAADEQPVVVYRQLPVIREPGQRHQAPKTVVQRLGRH